MLRSRPLLAACLFNAIVFAQNGPTVVGNGSFNSTDKQNSVAPGQLLTFRIADLTILPDYTDSHAGYRVLSLADQVPLPTEANGVSISLTQHLPLSQSDAIYALPIRSLIQYDVCESGAAVISPVPPPPHLRDCFISYVTVQIPYEIQVTHGAGQKVPSSVTITDNGTMSSNFSVVPDPAIARIVSDCDLDPARINQVCNPQVAHSDGTTVTADLPATLGETVSIFAWGLGKPTPLPMTGQASPDPPATLNPSSYVVSFEFGKNGLQQSEVLRRAIRVTPISVSMVPNRVGLYQISVNLPYGFARVPLCNLAKGVVSNLTISIVSKEISSVGICVAQ